MSRRPVRRAGTIRQPARSLWTGGWWCGGRQTETRGRQTETRGRPAEPRPGGGMFCGRSAARHGGAGAVCRRRLVSGAPRVWARRTAECRGFSGVECRGCSGVGVPRLLRSGSAAAATEWECRGRVEAVDGEEAEAPRCDRAGAAGPASRSAALQSPPPSTPASL